MTSFQSGYVSSHQFSHDGSHMHAGMVSSAANTSAGIPQPITAHEAIEVAGRNIEKMIHGDSQFASLADKLRIGNTTNYASFLLEMTNECCSLFELRCNQTL